ncbi:MAG TPA: DUF6529 family protein [Ktedonobacterales bacterium]|nr:DUF6529 family protein [Ktedonobacterales bacterium]
MRLAAALAAGALVTVSIGLLERHLLAAPYPIAYVHLFFTDTFYMKAWLASATLALGVGQLITAAGMYRVLRIAPPPRLTQLAHRWSGRVAMALTLPVAFNCLFELGVHPLDLRILVHALLGAFIYGVFVTKWLVLRVDRAPGWLVPLLGSALFTTILGLWLTSAYWLFSLYGWHL